MDLLRLAPIVVLATVVCAEAFALATASAHRFPRWFPWLLGAVSGFGLLLSVLALRGWLVVSPELGLLMIEGGGIAYMSIVALTVSCGITVGLLGPAIGVAVG